MLTNGTLTGVDDLIWGGFLFPSATMDTNVMTFAALEKQAAKERAAKAAVDHDRAKATEDHAKLFAAGPDLSHLPAGETAETLLERVRRANGETYHKDDEVGRILSARKEKLDQHVVVADRERRRRLMSESGELDIDPDEDSVQSLWDEEPWGDGDAAAGAEPREVTEARKRRLNLGRAGNLKQAADLKPRMASLPQPKQPSLPRPCALRPPDHEEYLHSGGGGSAEGERRRLAVDRLKDLRDGVDAHEHSLPNDPLFYLQDYLLSDTHGDGADDVGATEAWRIFNDDPYAGRKPIHIAVIDTGVDYNHEDLKDQLWKNPLEIPNNGIDDDGNGWVDDGRKHWEESACSVCSVRSPDF